MKAEKEERSLPLPIVEYPEGVQGFLSFKKSRDGSSYICSCMKSAVEIKLQNLEEKYHIIRESIKNDENQIHELYNYKLMYSKYFSDFFVSKLDMNIFNFDGYYKDRICHRCNNQIPTHSFGHSMYYGTFMRSFGWYYNIKLIEFGLSQDPLRIIDTEICPVEVRELLEFSFFDLINDIYEYQNDSVLDIELMSEYLKWLDQIYEDAFQKNDKSIFLNQNDQRVFFSKEVCKKCEFSMDKMSCSCNETIFGISPKYGEACFNYKVILQNEIMKRQRRVSNIVENEVRVEFGYKKIGDGWISETHLYEIIKRKFPNQTILRHYRPAFLERLELDIYIKELKIGIEYQGIQHFKPMKHFGGEKTLNELKERDKRKRMLCIKNDITLYYVNYNEVVSEQLINERII